MYVIIIVSFLALEIGGELSQGLCTQSSEVANWEFHLLDFGYDCIGTVWFFIEVLYSVEYMLLKHVGIKMFCFRKGIAKE